MQTARTGAFHTTARKLVSLIQRALQQCLHNTARKVQDDYIDTALQSLLSILPEALLELGANCEEKAPSDAFPPRMASHLLCQDITQL